MGLVRVVQKSLASKLLYKKFGHCNFGGGVHIEVLNLIFGAELVFFFFGRPLIASTPLF